MVNVLDQELSLQICLYSLCTAEPSLKRPFGLLPQRMINIIKRSSLVISKQSLIPLLSLFSAEHLAVVTQWSWLKGKKPGV